MQASPNKNLNEAMIDALDKRLGGMIKNKIPYDLELFEKAVNDPDIEEVRVFKLRHNMKIKIGSESFKVNRIRPDRIILERLEKDLSNE